MSRDPDRELWVIVVDFLKFQHRDAWRSRTPTWIKLFTELHHQDGWLDLSGHDRAVLVGLWIEYALSRGQLRLDTVSLSRRLNLRVTKPTLERLYHAGFVTFAASKPASITASEPASLEKRREEDKGPKQGRSAGKYRCPRCPTGDPLERTAAALAEHLHVVHFIDDQQEHTAAMREAGAT